MLMIVRSVKINGVIKIADVKIYDVDGLKATHNDIILITTTDNIVIFKE